MSVFQDNPPWHSTKGTRPPEEDPSPGNPNSQNHICFCFSTLVIWCWYVIQSHFQSSCRPSRFSFSYPVANHKKVIHRAIGQSVWFKGKPDCAVRISGPLQMKSRSHHSTLYHLPWSGMPWHGVTLHCHTVAKSPVVSFQSSLVSLWGSP